MMDFDQSQVVKMVREVIIARIKDELDEFSDKYDVPVDEIENLAISLYVKDVSKSQWKSSNAKFTKLFEKEVEMLFDNKIINFQEMGFMVFLAIKLTAFEDNMLRNKDGSFSTQKDIVEVSGMSKPTVSRMLKGLIQKKLIFEKKHESITNAKRYMISPYIFYKGKMMDSKLKDKLNGLSKTFIDTWNNNNNETKIDEGIEIDTEEFLYQIEEEIVNQYSKETYS